MILAPSYIGLCRQLFIIVSLLFISSCAYIIDDGDASVQYSWIQGANPWAFLSLTSTSYLTSSNGSVVDIDFGRVYNGTLSFANCNATSLCQISVPFTGSGITLHGVLFSGVSNFTVAVDGIQAPPPILHPAVPAVSPPLYNVTLYNLQDLTVAPHVLVITIVAWQLGESEIALDYVDVNELAATPTGPTSSLVPTYAGSTFSPYPSPIKSASHSKGVVIGAAVGGAIGGLVVISTIVALLILYFRSRKRSRAPPPPSEIDRNSKHPSYMSGPPSPHTTEPYMVYHSPHSIHTTAAQPMPNLPQL